MNTFKKLVLLDCVAKRTVRYAAYALILALTVSLITPKRLFADEKSHLKLAEEFMVLTDTAKMMTGAFDLLKSKQLEDLDKVDYPGKSPKKDRELKKRVADYLDNKLAWEDVREGYIKVYADVFTEEELKELMDFYSSPVGKKVLSNTNDMRMKLLLSTQAQLKGMTFDIKNIEKDFISEQKNEQENQEAR